MKKIKASQEELKGYLDSAKSSLKNEIQFYNRALTKGVLYPGELDLIEQNIKNYKEFIKLLESNIL